MRPWLVVAGTGFFKECRRGLTLRPANGLLRYFAKIGRDTNVLAVIR